MIDPSHTMKLHDQADSRIAELERELARAKEAMTFAADVCAELYAKYGLKIGPFSSQAQKANGMLRAALAPHGRDGEGRYVNFS
jgi:hypothetical protein